MNAECGHIAERNSIKQTERRRSERTELMAL